MKRETNISLRGMPVFLIYDTVLFNFKQYNIFVFCLTAKITYFKW